MRNILIFSDIFNGGFPFKVFIILLPKHTSQGTCLVFKDVYFGFPATQLAFTNKDKYTRVLVEKATANNFVKRRKDKHGNVNRAIYARVYFKNVQVITKSSNPALISSYENYLFAEIQKIEFFDFKNWVYNYIGHIN